MQRKKRKKQGVFRKDALRGGINHGSYRKGESGSSTRKESKRKRNETRRE